LRSNRSFSRRLKNYFTIHRILLIINNLISYNLLMGCACGRMDDKLHQYEDETVKLDMMRKKVSDTLKFYKIKDMSMVSKDEYVCVKKTSWKKTIFYNYKVMTLSGTKGTGDLYDNKRKAKLRSSLEKTILKNKLTKYFSFPHFENNEFFRFNNLSYSVLGLENNVKALSNSEVIKIDFSSGKQTLLVFINYPEDISQAIDSLKDVQNVNHYAVIKCNGYPVYTIKIDISNNTSDISKFYYIDGNTEGILDHIFANRTCVLMGENKEVLNYFTLDYLIALKDFINSGGYDIDFLLSEFKDTFLDDNDEFDKTSIHTQFSLNHTYSYDNTVTKTTIYPLLVTFSNKAVNEDLTSFLSKVPGCYVVYKDDNVVRRLGIILREFDLKYEIRAEKHKVYSSLLHGYRKNYNIKAVIYINDNVKLDRCNSIMKKVQSYDKNVSLYFLPGKEKKFDILNSNNVDVLNKVESLDDNTKDNIILFMHKNTDDISLVYIVENFDVIAKSFNKVLIYVEHKPNDEVIKHDCFKDWTTVFINELCTNDNLPYNIYYQPEKLKPDEFLIIITDSNNKIKFSDCLSMNEFIDGGANTFLGGTPITRQFYKSIKLEQKIIVRDVLNYDDNQILSTRRNREKCYIKNTLKSYGAHCRHLSHKTIGISYIKVYSEEAYYRNYKLTIRLPKSNMETGDFVSMIDLDKRSKLNLDLELYNVKSITPNNYCEDCHIKLNNFYFFCPVTQKSLCISCEATKTNPKESKYYPFSLFYIKLQSKPELLYSILEVNYENYKLTQESLDKNRYICFLCDEFIVKEKEMSFVWMNVLNVPTSERSYLCSCCINLVSDINRVEIELNNKESKLFEKLLEHDIDVNNMIFKKIVCLNK
jgi:hypothetical protein